MWGWWCCCCYYAIRQCNRALSLISTVWPLVGNHCLPPTASAVHRGVLSRAVRAARGPEAKGKGHRAQGAGRAVEMDSASRGWQNRFEGRQIAAEGRVCGARASAQLYAHHSYEWTTGTRWHCTITLHHHTAPSHCTTTLHYYIAPSRCTVTLHPHSTACGNTPPCPNAYAPATINDLVLPYD